MHKALIENAVKVKKEYEETRLQVMKIEAYNRRLSKQTGK